MDVVSTVKIFLGFIVAFVATWLLVPFVIKIAKKFNILDIPDGSIKKHKTPTPYLGGVAVYGGFMMGLSLAFLFPFPVGSAILFFLAGATMLLTLGFIDDLAPLKPLQKFFGQVLAALCFLKVGFLCQPGFFSASLLVMPLFVLWIVTLINAFNLIDVMDGLATLVALCASATFLVMALIWQEQQLAMLLAALLGALCAFFLYNRPPAKIYLGDAGSLFIGGVLGMVPCMFSWHATRVGAVVVSAIILAIPLLELASLIVIRTAKKIPFYKASPDHFSHYLLRAGWTKQFILWYVTFQGLFLGSIALLFVFNVIGSITVFFAGILFLCNWASIFYATKLT